MIFITILCFSLNLFITNSKAKTKDSEIKDTNYSIAVMIMLSFSIIYDLLIKRFIDNLYIYFAVFIIETCVLVYLNYKRIQIITQRHNILKQVLACITPLLDIPKGTKPEPEDDLGYTVEYDKKGYVSKIEISIEDPDKFQDGVITNIVLKLNKFLDNKRWSQQLNFQELTCTFIGTKLPPTMAKYPGSWLRPWALVPIGVDGENEIAINLNMDGDLEKRAAKSMFEFDENGIKTLAKTIIPSRTPQLLCLGATGGGKAIYINQEVEL